MSSRRQASPLLLALLILFSSLIGFYIAASSPIWGWDSLDSWMPRAYEYLSTGMLPVEHRHGNTLTAFYFWLTSFFHPLLSFSQSISAVVLLATALKLVIIVRLFATLKFGVLAGMALGLLLSLMPLAENLALSVGYSEVFCSFFLLSALAFTIETAVKPSLFSMLLATASLLILILLRNTGVVYAATVLFSSAAYIFFSRARSKIFWVSAFCALAGTFITIFVDVSAGGKSVSVDQYILTADSNEIKVEPKTRCGATLTNEGLQVRLYPTDPLNFRLEYDRDYMPLRVSFDSNGTARIKQPAYMVKKIWVKAPANSCSGALEGFAYFPYLTVSFFKNSIMMFSDSSFVVKALGYHLDVQSIKQVPLSKLMAVAFFENMSFSTSLLLIILATVGNIAARPGTHNCIRILQIVFFFASGSAVVLALHFVPYLYEHSAPGVDTLFSRASLPLLQANLFLSIASLWACFLQQNDTG